MRTTPSRRTSLGRTALLVLATIGLATGCGETRSAGESARGAVLRDTVRILAYNIHHGEGVDSVLDLERIAAVIRSVDPDLVALQEIDSVTTRTGGVDQASELARLTGLEARYGRFMAYRGGAYGMAILSRWPIEASANLRLPDGEEPRTALSVIVRSPVSGERLRFVGIHLYRTEEERMAQAVALDSLLSEGDLTTILAGDFNSTPDSPVMGRLGESWQPVAKGTDRFTFSSYDPVREIDFVLLRPGERFTVLSQRLLDEPVASDHRPVFVELLVGSEAGAGATPRGPGRGADTTGEAAEGGRTTVDAARSAAQSSQSDRRTVADVLAEAPDRAWQRPDPENIVYMELPGGRVVLELAPWSAPLHVENVRALIRAGAFDGGAVIRSQDNYVAQWAVREPGGDPDAEWPPEGVAPSLPAEFEAPGAGLIFEPLPDGDVYASEVGFVDGFAVGRDPESGLVWLAHCYGAVGVARGNDPDSGSGTQLYAVTGHAPRHLDRNLSMVGRVVAGMEHLTSLPRGTGELGFYESPEEREPILSVSVESDLPPEERLGIELLRTDSRAFREVVALRRDRTDPFFVYSSGRIDLCNVPVPNRISPGS
jgi:peptidylprolyl isomerase